MNVFLALLLGAYGLSGLLTGRISLNSRGFARVVLEGGPAWLMALAMVVGALVLLSVVVDHYDMRDNEAWYRWFRWGATRLGWLLLAAALIAHLWQFFIAEFGRIA